MTKEEQTDEEIEAMEEPQECEGCGDVVEASTLTSHIAYRQTYLEPEECFYFCEQCEYEVTTE